MNTPTLPRAWAELAIHEKSKASVTVLVSHALTRFHETRFWELQAQRFLRAEDKYAGMFPASPCLSEKNGERRYLECEICQEALSAHIDQWFTDIFLPRHPEWSEPSRELLQAEIERLKQPQMVLL